MLYRSYSFSPQIRVLYDREDTGEEATIKKEWVIKMRKMRLMQCITVLFLTLALCLTGTAEETFGSEYIVSHPEGETVTYIFEAECTDLTNKEGTAQSGTTLGREMATGGIGASNGGAVWGLNKNGVSVNFIIVSDRDVENAELILRAGTEFQMTTEFDASMFTIRIDPVSEEDVQPYTEGLGAWGNWDALFLDYYEPAVLVKTYDCEYGYISVTAPDSMASGFEDFTVYRNLNLQKGLNCISLITTNNIHPSDGATFYATAPVVDAIKITTDAQLRIVCAGE